MEFFQALLYLIIHYFFLGYFTNLFVWVVELFLKLLFAILTCLRIPTGCLSYFGCEGWLAEDAQAVYMARIHGFLGNPFNNKIVLWN